MVAANPEVVLVDTDVFSFIVKSDSRARLYEPDTAGRHACLSLMTVAEIKRWPLESGWGPRKVAGLERTIKAHTILLPDLETADIWAEVFTQRRKAGRPIQHGDCWIAATALRHGIPLVTHNARDYAEIPGLSVVSHGS